MATVPQIIASLEASADRADTSSEQMYDVANGPASGSGSTVSTDSGPVPTIAKWFSDNQALIDAQANLQAKLASGASGQGDNLIAVSQPIPGAVLRTQHDKNREILSSADSSTWPVQTFVVGVGNLNSSFVGSGTLIYGYNNLLALTSGFANKVFGNNCLKSNTTGFFNYAFGDQVLEFCTTGHTNNGFGPYTLGYLTTGLGNSGFGDDNQRYATTASFNASGGSQALYNNLTGDHNTGFGTYSLRGVANPPDLGPGTGPSPQFCSAYGSNSLYAATGIGNTAGGYSAGYATVGDYCTYWGTNAGLRITTGSRLVMIGNEAGSNASQPVDAIGTVLMGDGTWGATDSVVGGRSARAAGARAISFGALSRADGDNSMAFGYGVVAPNPNQIVFGNSLNTGNFFYGSLMPQTDNLQPVGGAMSRWSVFYAGTGTINTSDAREKQDIRPLSEKERAVARRLKDLIKAYRWRDAVALKGEEDARIHFGWIAQQVIEAFEIEGLDAFRYACCCRDEWEDEFYEWQDEFEILPAEYRITPAQIVNTGILGPDGNPIIRREPEIREMVKAEERRLIKAAGRTQTRVAGNRLGLRMDQVLAFAFSAS